MKKNKYLIAGNYVAAIVYLMFSFIAWDLNPSNWTSEFRIGTVVLWFILTHIVCMIILISSSKSEP
jgi:hypothetical protein